MPGSCISSSRLAEVRSRSGCFAAVLAEVAGFELEALSAGVDSVQSASDRTRIVSKTLLLMVPSLLSYPDPSGGGHRKWSGEGHAPVRLACVPARDGLTRARGSI